MQGIESRPDELLARAAAKGERAAVEELVTRIYPAVLRFYRKLSPEEAQDLTQSAMIRMIESLPKYRISGNSRFLSWVFRLAYNLFIDQTRKKRAEPVNDEVFGSMTDGKDAHSESDARDEARRLLRELPDELRAMVVLRYYMDFSYKEIAKAMETTEKRVKWRMHDAMEKLRKSYETEGQREEGIR